jgi:hypothetical protein
MGCLSLPFKLLGGVALVLALAVGWLYRDRLSAELGRLFDRSSAEASITTGRPGATALSSAKSKVDSLNGWRADSVVLTASQEGKVAVRAKLATARLPRELTGPLALALREREPVQAGGPIKVIGPGKAEWAVQSFRIRDFPIPRDAVPKLMAKAFGDSTRSIPVRIPAGIKEIRVHPYGAILLGAPRP